MDVNWDVVKYQFLDFIGKTICYDDFNNKMCSLKDNGKKGIYFEYFCKLYFNLIPSNKNIYSKFYLYNEIDSELKAKLNLPAKDKGIDALVMKNDSSYYKWCSIQVKFRSHNTKPIPFGEIATFQALTFGSNVVDIKQGIFFTNCYDVCDELKNDKYCNITYGCFNKCDKLFWDNVREYIGHKKMTKYIPLSPLPYQINIIEKIEKHYKRYDYGRLYLPCGTGKTFLGMWTCFNILNCESVFIAVPSLYLLSETFDYYEKELQYNKSKFHFILIGSDMDKKEGGLCEYTLTTNKNDIKMELKENKYLVVITTYHSSELLVGVCKECDYQFDLGIFDEAHRTVGEIDKQFTCLLLNDDISKKRLFMTATEKIYQGENKKILSMDNENVYGKIIYNYSTRQAIEDSKGKKYGLVDYKIVAPFISTCQHKALVNNNNFIQVMNEIYAMDIIVLGMMILSSMETCGFTHLLIFSNTNKKANEIIQVIDKLLEYQAMSKYEKILFKKQTKNTCKFMEIIKSYLGHDYKDFDENNIYLQYLSGNDSMTIRRSEVKQFEQSKKGIISSARIFGEGVNIKICDAICFADNKCSTVDIIQYVGRCLRKCPDLKPNKISYILIPLLLNNDDNFFDPDSKPYSKLRTILKSLGNTDNMITDKFILTDCNKLNNNNSALEQKIKIGSEININKFREQIISRIFDRAGDPEYRWRNLIINENKKRFNKLPLIDTKKKCILFLKNNGINKLPCTKNWIKYCLGNTLFNKIKKQYHYTEKNILKATNKIQIYDLHDYKKLHVQDKMLPSINYINDGFYSDMNPKFNLTALLDSVQYDCDF